MEYTGAATTANHLTNAFPNRSGRIPMPVSRICRDKSIIPLTEASAETRQSVQSSTFRNVRRTHAWAKS
ncbi:hypothetical protein SMG44B_10591 [Stenotrophomonas maltophilia]|nr:hypothetical protein BN126330133 [Stenotrophomonas maltophilia]